ncbi:MULTISPECIES: LysR family transcriptional regulator [unclassified Nocardia]|uniref:LysR family transcriptional regulator n=1 Tax=unclassified Nocardia TaxID=2637762 RepID=UPI0027DF0273|nr:MULTISPECIES: LysR family transcriptional regulator [unclassified Nocardia]
MEVELRHLRAFTAVARHRSFTAAAAELLITQPALSRTVRQLEAILRIRLLDRSSRQVHLTETGAEFLTQAERVLAAVDQALDVARKRIVLRLGFAWLLPDPWAQDAVAGFEETTGGTVTMVRVDDPVAALRNNVIDIALVRGDIRPSGMRRVPLYEERRIAICSERSDLATYPRLDWSEVRNWPLVINTLSGTTTPALWPPELRPQRLVETANYDEWLESVAANRGIGITPTVAQRRNIHSAVRYVPLTGAPTVGVQLCYPNQHGGKLIRDFVEAARRAVPKHQD